MATKPNPRIRMPATARKGDVVEVRTLISHDMEPGFRRDHTGKVLPRKIINRFAVSFKGQEVLTADWHPAVSGDPFLAFWLRATETGTYVFTWRDDDGGIYRAEHTMKVT